MSALDRLAQQYNAGQSIWRRASIRLILAEAGLIERDDLPLVDAIAECRQISDRERIAELTAELSHALARIADLESKLPG